MGLDCFAGSGSGPAAAAAEGLHCVGIELDQDHVDYAHARIPALLEQAEAISQGKKPQGAPKRTKATRPEPQLGLTFIPAPVPPANE